MKRIRINGKAMSKYDIARILEAIDFQTHATLVYEAYNYQEMCEWLYRKLKANPHHYYNLSKIEWFDNLAPF